MDEPSGASEQRPAPSPGLPQQPAGPPGAAPLATHRVWRGIPRDERVQERRTRFLAAGLDVFGTVGAREATVSLVCQRAGLTQRYFYESFPTLKVLLAEVFTQISERQHTELAAAVVAVRTEGGSLHDAARAALLVYFGGLQEDPRVARVQLLEILGSDGATDRCYQAAIRRAADLILFLSDLRDVARPAVPRLLALGLIGAVVEIATMWLLSDFADPVDAVAASALLIFDAVIGAELGSAAPAS